VYQRGDGSLCQVGQLAVIDAERGVEAVCGVRMDAVIKLTSVRVDPVLIGRSQVQILLLHERRELVEVL